MNKVTIIITIMPSIVILLLITINMTIMIKTKIKKKTKNIYTMCTNMKKINAGYVLNITMRVLRSLGAPFFPFFHMQYYFIIACL